jgi:hypothetical protein
MNKTVLAPEAKADSPPTPVFGLVVRGPRRLPQRERLQPVTREAQRAAAAVLEVLAGTRTPGEAAAALGVSPPRYYLLEQRALAGLVAACEPRSACRGQSPRCRILQLEKEVSQLRQECARQQALVRASQRTIGLAPPPPKPPVKPGGKKDGKSGGGGKKARHRRPVVRALKAAVAVRAATVEEETVNPSGVVSAEVLQPAVASSPSPPAGPLHGATDAAGG